MNPIKLNCYHIYSDYTSSYDKEINLDKYYSFELSFRDDSWHIKGYCKCNDKIITEELSDHGIYDFRSLTNFIKIAGNKIHKISTNRENFNLILEINKLLKHMNQNNK